jgi:D-glycero-alpha-D-manno-heptose 1-phosphate guanylyltransferase
MVNTAIILAGGLGTRLRNVAPTVPKPMASINNRPFLEYLMDFWIEQGVSNFILSVGYLKNKIIEHFGNEYKGANIKYTIELKPLGTGGALLLAGKDLNDTFLVLNGDTFIEIDLKRFYSFHVKSESNWSIALFRTSNVSRYTGIDINKNGQINSLISELKNSDALANGGAYLMEPKIFDLLACNSRDCVSLENELLPNFVSNGGVLFGKEFKGKFIDIGIPEDFYRAQDILPN